MKTHGLCIGFVGACFLAGMNVFASTHSLVQTLTTQQLVQSGRESFVKRCSGCHGIDAKGAGEAALMLNPRPRNLAEGSFKFRSTTSGSLPTTQDLLRTLNQGVPGTSMPSFRLVSEAEKLALVAYIKSLRPDWSEREVEKNVLSLPPPPREMFSTKAQLMDAAAKGRKHYVEACLSCHGEEGKGNGESASGLTDETGATILPANLRQKFIKSGKRAQDVFKAISTGLDGTPMPGFADSYSEAQRWEIVAYIFYLRGRGAGIYSETDVIGGENGVKR